MASSGYEFIIPTGVIIPDTSKLLAEVQTAYKDAFGQDLIVNPNTPQGVLIAAEVIARAEVLSNNAALANQINPNISGGVFLDAILALTGGARNANFFTRVQASLTGISGTIISEGVKVKDTVNNISFKSESTVTLIGSPGIATVYFSAEVPGAFEVLPETLTQIVTSVIGWETVTNEFPGVPGSLEQSDPSTRNLRRQSLAAQGSSLSEAIISALYLTPGVKSLKYRENISDITTVIDGVTLVPHSIYVDVSGGTDIDVATSILSKKSGGCNYNGAVSVPLVEPFSGQTYTILFDRPIAVPILVKATVRVGTSIRDPEIAVKAAIMAYANGLIEGQVGFAVGESVSCFELSGAINILEPGMYVQKVETSLISPIVYSSNEIPIDIQHIATILESSITVIIIP